ncbi:MAG: CRISPR-associated endonuclease Cas2 [Candidatus Paceibacterota bacterium]
MEELEKKGRERRKRAKIQDTVLGIIGAAGVIAAVMIAPNMFQVLPHLMGRGKYRLKFQTKTVVGRLLVKGYIRKDVRGMLQITDSGQRHLALEQARNSEPAKRKRRWDKRYRLVMFDISQKRRNARDRLRLLMREFGFLRLQDSVWVSPYDCEELIALIKAELRVGNDVLYAVVEQIGNEKQIKSHFGLS